MKPAGFDPLADSPILVEGWIGVIQMGEIDLQALVVYQSLQEIHALLDHGVTDLLDSAPWLLVGGKEGAVK